MKDLTIDEIEKAVFGVMLKGNRNNKINKVSTDSRKVDRDTLFIPLKGEKFDGHDFLEQVVKSGCKKIIASNWEKCSEILGEDVDIIIVDNTLEALQALAKYYLSILNLKKIAVTGSVGKTSTRDMVNYVCKEKYITGATVGNFNNDIGVPLTIFSLDETMEAAVIEMGMDHFNEIHRLVDIVRPDVGVITTIGTSHMENLGSREGIRKAKMEIVDFFTPENTLIYNNSCDLLDENSTKGNYERVSIGIDTCNYRVKDIVDLGEEGVNFTLVVDERDYPVSLNVPGAHNAFNAALAIAAGVSIGVEIESAIEGLKKLELTGKRLTVKEGQNIKVIDDTYNASPESMKSAINTLINSTGNRKIAILGDMYELGNDTIEFHKEVGKYGAEKDVDIILGVGELGRNIAYGALEKLGKERAIAFNSKDELNQALADIIKPGDTVLVKGSRGIAMETIVEKLIHE